MIQYLCGHTLGKANALRRGPDRFLPVVDYCCECCPVFWVIRQLPVIFLVTPSRDIWVLANNLRRKLNPIRVEIVRMQQKFTFRPVDRQALEGHVMASILYIVFM